MWILTDEGKMLNLNRARMVCVHGNKVAAEYGGNYFEAIATCKSPEEANRVVRRLFAVMGDFDSKDFVFEGD